VIRAVGQAPRSLGSVVPTSGRIVGHPETDHYQGVEPPELRALAARIEWTPQARASVRRIDRQTVLNLLEALADYVFTDYGDVERWQDLGLPASAGCAACACRSTVRLIGATQRAGYFGTAQQRLEARLPLQRSEIRVDGEPAWSQVIRHLE